MADKKKDVITSRPHSVFNIVLIDDPEILGERGIIFVHNVSDKEILKKRMTTNKSAPSLAEIIPAEKVGGHNKPAGWGCPGGGMKDYERPQDAASTELMEETGLVALSVTEILPDVHKFIPVNKKTDDVGGRPIVLPRGCQPYQGWNTRTTNMVENIVHVFHAKVDWQSSPLREVFRKAKAAWLAEGFSEEEIQKEGIFFFFDQLKPETLKMLGLDENGLEEIDGLALIPISCIIAAPSEGICISGEEAGDKLYRSHLRFVRDALQKLGLNYNA